MEENQTTEVEKKKKEKRSLEQRVSGAKQLTSLLLPILLVCTIVWIGVDITWSVIGGVALVLTRLTT